MAVPKGTDQFPSCSSTHMLSLTGQEIFQDPGGIEYG
jgi:hypothetical protein